MVLSISYDGYNFFLLENYPVEYIKPHEKCFICTVFSTSMLYCKNGRRKTFEFNECTYLTVRKNLFRVIRNQNILVTNQRIETEAAPHSSLANVLDKLEVLCSWNSDESDSGKQNPRETVKLIQSISRETTLLTHEFMDKTHYFLDES